MINTGTYSASPWHSHQHIALGSWMLPLSLTAYRARSAHGQVSRLILDGNIAEAMRLGRTSMGIQTGPGAAWARAHIGQMVGRCLQLVGLEEDAEELFRRQLRHYQDLSRAHSRWLGGLDEGSLALHRNSPVRAAQAFSAVADDPMAELPLRIEAMALAGLALHAGGEFRAAWKYVQSARQRAGEQGEEMTVRLVDAVRLEIAAREHICRPDGQTEKASSANDFGGLEEEPLAQGQGLELQLTQAVRHLEQLVPLAAQRLAYLARMLASGKTQAVGATPAVHATCWTRTGPHRSLGEKQPGCGPSCASSG